MVFAQRLSFVLVFFFTLVTSAQTDSTTTVVDSVPAVTTGDDFVKKLAELEKQRFADSIRRADLEARLDAVSSTNNRERTQLEAQLKQFETKESELLEKKRLQIESLKKTTRGFPVAGFEDDTLFLIYNRLGSFSAQERANAISSRIKRLTETLEFFSDSLKVNENEATVDVIYGNQTIASVTEVDALWFETTPLALATSYKEIIADAVTVYKEEHSLINLLKSIGMALLVIIVMGLIIKYVLRLFRWTALKIQRQKHKRLKAVTVKNYTLLDTERQVHVLLLINRILKWVTVLLAIYIALPLIFGFFPQTEAFAHELLGYIINPIKGIFLAIWNYLPNIFAIVVIIVVFRLLLKFLNFLKVEIAEGRLTFNGFYPDWANPTYQLVRVLVIAFAFVVIFPYLPGSESPVFQGISVFLGFLFTFGSAGSLSNVIAGLVLTYMRLFKIGDRVKIGEIVGDVIEKSSLVTRVRTPKNEIISIPNSTVMSSHTINYSSDAPEKGLIIHTTVTIGYDIPWKVMHQTLIDAALRTDLVLKDPQPFVLQTSLEDFYVAYQINAYVREANKQASIYSNLHQNIQDVCNENGIEILSPHYRAARDGNQSTIPSDYLPKDYVAPSFNVKTQSDSKKSE
ncbi:mechanosensitive ion channel domain-containing protein [Leeuwenhoekiella palythoae]|uniref:Mechanosensitive ion channel n=1 Tax=Leeuwenhoekiella palythoae TaxID=573501 RepID=A0A1M5XP50_9FLAO|nr:mechanosensitive ion channel domain-containing protein [Leeuwenhoekiella palythoae]MEC7785166.1 mechanosensitive ion channel domain-containing protein [Bacteroidota bacterium]MEE3226134.1 mechanosensitive ion channel domain-containing protein [Bacteroidota bacterium]RXG30168.1 mechanosensitive ion channel-like protein [Leeuwenhoekiella palythoae]SHI01617.1 Mechanosensitive ion channel [Leeuwenhoekiella palythoae]